MIMRMHQVQNAARIAMGDYGVFHDGTDRRHARRGAGRIAAALPAVILLAAGLLLAYQF